VTVSTFKDTQQMVMYMKTDITYGTPSVDAWKTSIINGLAFKGLCGTNCEDDGATVLDNLQ
jgi:hypothetical protein